MNEPKVTVILPTRERGDALESALRTVTEQRYENLEIVVSDNCSHDRTGEIARSTGDRRVRYLNTGRRLSMSHNWEFALSHVTGGAGWVTIIGDARLVESTCPCLDVIHHCDADIPPVIEHRQVEVSGAPTHDPREPLPGTANLTARLQGDSQAPGFVRCQRWPKVEAHV